MKNRPIHPLATVLCIAGSDSSAGAGLQADLKTIHALGGYALTVPTAITAQNSFGVTAVYPLAPEIVQVQLETLFADYQIQAIKIGMLGNLGILKVVLDCLQQHPEIPMVLDPVLMSSSGRPLLEAEALPLFIKTLLPLATVVTPNIPELNALIQSSTPYTTFRGQADEVPEMAECLFSLGVQNAVIKGGHSIETEAIDYLVMSNNASYNPHHLPSIQAYSSLRLETPNTHGTGCTYSSALAVELAKGKALPQAVKASKAYLLKVLLSAQQGQGQPQYITHTLPLESQRKGGLHHLDVSENQTLLK